MFYEGMFQGSGTLYRDNFTIIYAGEFEYNAFNGIGTLYDQNGNIIHKGDFINGKEIISIITHPFNAFTGETFGDNVCFCCLNHIGNTFTIMDCRHKLCNICYDQLQPTLCPMCRKPIHAIYQ